MTKADILMCLATFPDETEIVLDLSAIQRSSIFTDGQGDDIRWYTLVIDDSWDCSDEHGPAAMAWLKPTECIMRGANDAEMSEVLPYLMEHVDDTEPSTTEHDQETNDDEENS